MKSDILRQFTDIELKKSAKGFSITNQFFNTKKMPILD